MMRKFKNQIGNPNALDWQQIQQDFATYGARKCSDGGPTACKCDCNLDGIEDFILPLPYEAMGNWIPNYPQPTSLQNAMIIDHLCCYNACNGECFGPQQALSDSDGITPLGGTQGGGGGFQTQNPIRGRVPQRPQMPTPRRRSSKRTRVVRPRGLFGISFGGLKIR